MATSMVYGRLPCLSLLRHVEHARALLSPCSSRVYSSVESYEQGGAQEQQQDQPGNSEEQLRQSLLDGALRHVEQLGWTQAALAAAARDRGLSPSVAGLLGRGEVELVEHFVELCNRRLSEELAARSGELAELRVRDRLEAGMRARLQMLEPVIGSWPQALALQAAPAALPRTVQLYADLAERLWRAAGDTSTDLSWYSRRALAMGVYASTELYMLSDCSPGFADTWTALARRLDDAARLVPWR